MSTQFHKTPLPTLGTPISFSFIEPADGTGTGNEGHYRFNPEAPCAGEIVSLLADLRTYVQRLAAYRFSYLHVSVDGEEVAIFSPQGTACEPFKVPTTASCIEVVGEDYDGELLLAAFPLTHLDPCRRIDAHHMAVTCGEGLSIRLIVSSLADEGAELEYWIVRLEFASDTIQAKGALAGEEPLILVLDGLDRLDLHKLGKPLLQPNTNPLVRIVVVGIGSSGSNTVDKMIEAGIEGVSFAALNTDLQALQRSHAPTKVQLGSMLTQGLGAGSRPAIGRAAAIESTEKIVEVLEGADMVFITTGLGGGTGTGAAPIVASLAKELGALTVAVVTTPFLFEGQQRMRQAGEGRSLLCDRADTVITLPNERLLHTLHKTVSLHRAFAATDDVLRHGVQSILDLVTIPGLINLDFADVRAVMSNMGSAFLGTGRGSGELRALDATQKAICSPLVEEATIEGAKGVLINITGSSDLTLYEVNEATSIIREVVDDDANIIFGAVIDESLRDEMRITVIATGYSQT